MFCVAGFVPKLDFLDVICRISYNYCNSYLLSKLIKSSKQRNLGISYQTPAFSCQHWQLDDVILFVSETSKSLLKIIRSVVTIVM